MNTPGKIRIATTVDYPPFCYKEGELVKGFHVQALCDVLAEEGIVHDVNCFAWTELADLLRMSESYAAFACGMTYTVERESLGVFSGPWIDSSSILVSPKGMSDASISRLAVNQGGYLEGLARTHFPNVALTLCDDNAFLPQLLQTGVASHVLTDELEFLAWKSRGFDGFVCNRVVNEQRQGLFFKDRVFGERWQQLLANPAHQEKILSLAAEHGIEHRCVKFV